VEKKEEDLCVEGDQAAILLLFKRVEKLAVRGTYGKFQLD
jgi:hypothetical protein